MDISSLSSLNSATTIASNTTSKLEKNLSSDYASASDTQLMDVCKEFESYFLEQMFKEMQKTIPESEFTSSSTSTLVDYVKDATIQELSSQSTEQNSLGLAQTLYDQMKRNFG